jgi:hypothetical protein
MHEIFTDRYFDLEFHVKCADQQEFINLINTLKTQTNVNPSLIQSYSGDLNDYCCATMRGCGDLEYVCLGEMIGHYACDHNNNAFLDILQDKHYHVLFDQIIHYAVDNDAIEQVEYILNINSAYANAAGHRGKTPLYHAITNVNVPMVKLLLRHGANPAYTYGMAGTNYLDHALWVYDHYYGDDQYNADKITIIELIMMRNECEPTMDLSPEQRAIYDKIQQKIAEYNKEEQEYWEKLAEEDRAQREQEEWDEAFERAFAEQDYDSEEEDYLNDVPSRRLPQSVREAMLREQEKAELKAKGQWSRSKYGYF